ncbi:MAG: response regulator [Bacilli bacterium]|nr:response regulator [Bacilli bacterium]
MKGQIKVFSTPNQGTTFIVTLTFEVDIAKEEERILSLSNQQFVNIRTLVLEKSGASMNLIDSYLGVLGMHCELTSSEARAYSMIEAANATFTQPFDLLIIDYQTPSSGGFEFIDKLKSNRHLAKIPKVIMLMPMMKEDLFNQLKTHGIDVGLEKPIIPSILLNAIVDIFQLKAITSSELDESSTTALPKLTRKVKVLLVEDNKTNQIIASSLLKQVEIDCIIAGDGEAAVKAFEEHRGEIDLILMDLHMPIMNGYEASTAIRQQSKTVPIVAMTADVIMGVKEKCEACGMHYYISKPFDPDRFLSTIVDIILEQEQLSTNNILNLEKGLKNLGNNQALYHEVLKIFHEENQNYLNDFKGLMEQKAYHEASKLVHKIKGSSGSIGAERLYQQAILFQKVLSEVNEEEIRDLYPIFVEMFTQLLQEIETHLKKDKEVDPFKEKNI